MRQPSKLRGPGGPVLFTPERSLSVVAPGAVHVPDWLLPDEQRDLVDAGRRWVAGPGTLKQHVLPGGGVMSVRSGVLGETWRDSWFRENEHREYVPAPLPLELLDLARRAIEDSYGPDAPEVETFLPTTTLINFYDATARMGMHQDLDETGPDPIVSISLGDTCVFRFGNASGRGQPYQDIELRSGDLFVFGRDSRWAFHGVPGVKPGTGDPALGMRDGGRLNLTIRRTNRAP